MAESGRAWSASGEQAASRQRMERLPRGLAMLVIAGLSTALWAGIIRLIAALF